MMNQSFSDDAIKQDIPLYGGKIRFLTVAVSIGVVLAVGIAIWELYLGNYTRALADLFFPLSAPILIYLLWRRRDLELLLMQVFSFTIFLQQSSVVLYLHDINQMIWIPTYPLVYFYLLGHKGWTWSALLFVELWLMYLIFPGLNGLQTVSLEAMNNFMVAYLVTTLLSWMYSREVLFYQRKVTRRAHYDFLTNIYNRVAWLDRLNQELALQKRVDNLDISIIMFDVDDFKHINDQHGHHVGDQVLTEITGLMARRLRKCDVLGRWGGEEFVILLPNTNLKQATAVADELRMQLESQMRDRLGITMSLGVTQYHGDEDVDELLQRVDGLLYEAKAAGKNRVVAA